MVGRWAIRTTCLRGTEVELLPGEQERIVRLLVERVDLTDAGAQIRLNLEGLAGLARDMAAKEAIAA